MRTRISAPPTPFLNPGAPWPESEPLARRSLSTLNTHPQSHARWIKAELGIFSIRGVALQ